MADLPDFKWDALRPNDKVVIIGGGQSGRTHFAHHLVCVMDLVSVTGFQRALAMSKTEAAYHEWGGPTGVLRRECVLSTFDAKAYRRFLDARGTQMKLLVLDNVEYARGFAKAVVEWRRDCGVVAVMHNPPSSMLNAATWVFLASRLKKGFRLKTVAVHTRATKAELKDAHRGLGKYEFLALHVPSGNLFKASAPDCAIFKLKAVH